MREVVELRRQEGRQVDLGLCPHRREDGLRDLGEHLDVGDRLDEEVDLETRAHPHGHAGGRLHQEAGLVAIRFRPHPLHLGLVPRVALRIKAKIFAMFRVQIQRLC